MDETVASSSESKTGKTSDLDHAMENGENCSSLARSDSGQGKSLSTAEPDSENNVPTERPNQIDILGLTSENVGNTERVTAKDKNLLENISENNNPMQQRAFLHTQTDPDSGIERSPVAEHFPFLQCDASVVISNAALSVQDQDKSSSHLQRICAKDAILLRKELKDNYEGPVSILSNRDNSRSETESLKPRDACAFEGHQNGNNSMKSVSCIGEQRSIPKIKRQSSIDFPSLGPSLDPHSFDKDKPLNGQTARDRSETCSCIPSPAMSIQLSTDFCGQSCQHFDHIYTRSPTKAFDNGSQSNPVSNSNLSQLPSHYSNFNRCFENHVAAHPITVALQNGHTKQCSTLPSSSALPAPGNATCHTSLSISPQGMVSKNTMDQLTKELIMAKDKVIELQHQNSDLRMVNYELMREQQTASEIKSSLAKGQLQLETCLQSLSNLQELADLWKSRYYETKRELDAKQAQLQSKQRELDLKESELAAKQRELEDVHCDLEAKQHELEARQYGLEANQCELDSKKVECDKLIQENDDLKKAAWLREGHENMEGRDSPVAEHQLPASLLVHVRHVVAESEETQAKSVYNDS